MSSLIVEVVKLDAVLPHTNADRLEFARVKGWNVVVGKGAFQAGDLAVYFPVDAILPPDLEAKLFPPGSKIKLHNSRIRTIKIRGAVSQGMLVPCSELGIDRPEAGMDVAERLGVTKYEPPEPTHLLSPKDPNAKKGGRAQINPNFQKYTDIENIKNYPSVFQEGDQVYISEKMHGTSSRYGWVPRHYQDGFRGRLKKLLDSVLIHFRLKDKYEFVYGTRNVQLQAGTNQSWYAVDVYTEILEQERFREKLHYGECVYGEIVGDRIQKNYSYGCGPGQHLFFAYDVMVDGRWLDHDEFVRFCDQRNIPRVPQLYVGPYSKEIELKHRDGDSTVGGQKVREGVVIKPVKEAVSSCGRMVLKSISDAYYLEENDDFH